jgi:hypothetical protein
MANTYEDCMAKFKNINIDDVDMNDESDNSNDSNDSYSDFPDEIIKKFLSYGICVKTLNDSDRFHIDAIKVFLLRNDDDFLINFLIKNLTVIDFSDIYITCFHNSCKCFRLLIDEIMLLYNNKDFLYDMVGRSILKLICELDRLELLKILLRYYNEKPIVENCSNEARYLIEYTNYSYSFS